MKLLLACVLSSVYGQAELKAKSGMLPWVDTDTPANVQTTVSSRGETWNLVMSDEFNQDGRRFEPGRDHMWTALDIPDGVNAALEYYSPNMTLTKDGYFQIISMEDKIDFQVYNLYAKPPGFQNKTMYYRSGMVQSWNKFCLQGGKIEVRAQLPGAVSSSSGNPDVARGANSRTRAGEYYPTWPGIWLLGNLGRALFSGSTNRMWPWSFDECVPELEKDQRISACNANPGSGLNPRQGRGAPEIDILEGGGLGISSSIQVAPGMPDEYRLFPPDSSNPYCASSFDCKNQGANIPDVPTAYYAAQRPGYRSWYQGLRYAPNTECTSDSGDIQSATAIKQSVEDGIEENTCSIATCPASYDVNGDLGLIDGKGSKYWGINSDGTCMPVINSYMGAYLCDPDNQNSKCTSPRSQNAPPTNLVEPFNYQMDAISANWPIHVGAYTGFLNYQIEWVTGKDGYIRWMLDDIPLYEIPSSSITDPPQSSKKNNYRKLMVEEPMYMIFNVALSTSWSATPPNPGGPCEGVVCKSFPMALKIDYIRVWQNSKMSIGCSPSSHPTRQFIKDNIGDYSDASNPVIAVAGGARCRSDDDCTVASIAGALVKTGKCSTSSGRCECFTPKQWGGPRCTSAVGSESEDDFGPSFTVVVSTLGTLLALLIGIVIYRGTHQSAPVEFTEQSESNIPLATELPSPVNGSAT